MGDLAPRPRGGWQVGTHVSRMRREVGSEGVDPSPDCYTVDRPAPGKFVVRHYRNPVTRQVCCSVELQARADEADGEVLSRAFPPFGICARKQRGNGGEEADGAAK